MDGRMTEEQRHKQVQSCVALLIIGCIVLGGLGLLTAMGAL